MTVIGKTSHAMFFNGVSDGIVVPQANFSRTGFAKTTGKSYTGSVGESRERSEHTKMAKVTQSFTIEAWVIPDCGGVIAAKDGLFELRIGDIGTPGPAQFRLHTHDEEVGEQTITISTASPHIPTSGGSASTHNGWDGVVYPTHPNDTLHGTHNRFDTGLNNETALNRNVRDLIHVAGIFTGEQIKLYVNGDLAASEKVNKKVRLNKSASDLYIGGRGGEFRGTIEGVHWRRGFNESGLRPGPLVSSADSIALWRFEEPVDIPQLEMHLTTAATASTSNSGSTLTVNNADGKMLLQHITGSIPTTTTTLDLTTSSTYSNGDYLIDGVADIPHTPINLLINPTGIDERTGVAYQTSPPERVRVKSITWNADGTTASTIQVYSIHLDFDNHASGLRGLLHNHAAYDTTNHKALGSTVVIINSDLLVDSGTGKPLRSTGFGTQTIDRTGQMVIDEVGGNHGFVFNRQLSTDTTTNPFAFNWGATGLSEGFQAGHTGRHLFSHISGHPFLRSLPPSLDEVVNRELNGESDSFSAYFDGSSMGLKNQIPIGSVLDIHRQAYVGPALSVESESTVVQSVENGMVSADASQRQLIAIGGAGFSPLPFLLKGHASIGEDGTFDTNNLHLTPEDEPRIAILEVPSLATGGNTMAPYVEIHYNAIDFKGTTIQYAATGTTSAVWDNVNHRITLIANGAKAFGAHNGTFDGYNLICDGERAFDTTGTVTFTIDTTNHRLTATSGGASVRAAFEAKIAAAGAIVYLELTGPALCITKTVPSAATVMAAGGQVADHIHTALANGATLHAPGGIIRIDDAEMGKGSIAMVPHRLVGDNTGGTAYEIELDTSKLPANHVPQHTTDIPQKPPEGIIASHVTNISHPSIYHKLIIRPASSGTSSSNSTDSPDPPPDTAPSNFVISPIKEATSNANGVFDRPATTHRSNLFEMFDIIDNWQLDNTHCIVVHPSLRSRTMQLKKFIGKETQHYDPNYISIEFMQTRGRLKEFRDSRGKSGRSLVLKGVGLLQDIRTSQASLLGDGSPDSHPIKEITPGGPVVSVSLGGPGQGAIDTKPTYDPSPIARIGWNTRRPCGAVVNYIFSSGSPSKIALIPFNNNSEALASWGHICFPPSSGDVANPTARIWLGNGASAAYYDIVDGVLLFPTSDPNGINGWFTDRNGVSHATLTDWVTSNGITIGTTIYTDPYIGEDTMCRDGTTVQDRMFQKADSVSHDYQLGTQYASTRALVEIPLFPQQFFEDRENAIFPGPNNSMKLTFDATMTAHTWAPNPVGTRMCAFDAADDPTVLGPYHYKWAANAHNQGTTITSLPVVPQGGAVVVPYTGGLSAVCRLYIENGDLFPDASGYRGVKRRGGGTTAFRKAVLSNGEWCIYSDLHRSSIPGQSYLFIPLLAHANNNQFISDKFLETMEVGMSIRPAGIEPFNPNIPVIAEGGGDRAVRMISAPDSEIRAIGQEFRSNTYFDKGSVQTQGGNIDYGLKQYASAVEFKAGPIENPHLHKLQPKAWRGIVTAATIAGGGAVKITTDNAANFPRIGAMLRWNLESVVDWKVLNLRNQEVFAINYVANMSAGVDAYSLSVKKWSSYTNPTVGRYQDIHNGDELVILGLEINPNNGAYAARYPNVKYRDAILNREWLYPYASGGLRNGDTIWMNMHYTNPHAIDGMFCKSRGVVNEWQVHSMFNGGQGEFGFRSRESIPMENFLIGRNCRETAENFAQHVNQTVAHNTSQIGHSYRTEEKRIVAFLDPYLCTDDHARVILYDVNHDREFIAFHDIHMQVQTDMDAVEIDNLDVANGYPSQQYNKNPQIYVAGLTETYRGDATAVAERTAKVRSNVGRSTFIEGAYSHQDQILLNIDNTDNTGVKPAFGRSLNPGTADVQRNYNQHPIGSMCDDGRIKRTTDGSCCTSEAELWFGQDIYILENAKDFYKNLDILELLADGTTTAPVYAGWTGNSPDTGLRFGTTQMDTPDGTRVIPAFLCLKGIRTTPFSPTSTQIVKDLPHWEQMEFTRRLTVDLGEVGIKEGITNIEAAAREVVRLINQAGAPKGRSNLRKPDDQFAGSKISTTDPSAKHINADYAVTGSTHDPAPFWDESGLASYDRGSHMGYLRAHIGRVVEDMNGNEGFSVVIHSTIPGATGRNFAVWLDNSHGQSTYTPQFLIGHGGRFRNFYCQPTEIWGECMHPAPMPINKHGRPFAPITTLHELSTTGNPANGLQTNNKAIPPSGFTISAETPTEPKRVYAGGGLESNTVNTESTTPNEQSVVHGLRKATPAHGRINFGGLTATGIPGWSPDLGLWGFGESGLDERAHKIYNQMDSLTDTTAHVPPSDELEVGGDGQLYAVEFEDHKGTMHRIRIVYKQYGQSFTNTLTTLPDTIENEIVIWIDDRDVGQGGFTIGRAMKGKGDIGGRINPSGEWATSAGTTSISDTTNISFATAPTLSALVDAGLTDYCGNRWNPMYVPNGAYAVTLTRPVGTTGTLELAQASHSANTFGRTNMGIWHDLPSEGDALGFLGFPKENGIIQITIPDNAAKENIISTGQYISYTHRTTGAANTQHSFFGCRNIPSQLVAWSTAQVGPNDYDEAIAPVCISARPNWTTLVTDELLAAVVEYALNITDPNSKNEFDCSKLYAADGRTFGEWGVSPSAITVQAYNPDVDIIPLSNLFNVERTPDWGILDAHLKEAQVSITHGGWGGATYLDPANIEPSRAGLYGIKNAAIDAGMSLPCGYMPHTVLHITTRYVGPNANTPTPRVVDSSNLPIDITAWTKNLRGETNRFWKGDRIIPRIENNLIRSRGITGDNVDTEWSIDVGETCVVNAATHATDQLFQLGPVGRVKTEDVNGISGAGAAHRPFHPPGGSQGQDASYAEHYKMWIDDEEYAVLEPLAYDQGTTTTPYCGGGTIPLGGFVTPIGTLHRHIFSRLTGGSLGIVNGSTTQTITESKNFYATYTAAVSILFQRHRNKPEFIGMRTTGSDAKAQPLVYFRGASTSHDNWVPLYFGGGFSGAVLDINDGTQNDYTEFYTHPYSAGPTGTAGIQNANEIMGSHAILDTQAMMAMFPGTAYLDQHKGQAVPPFTNKDLQLSSDMGVGTGTEVPTVKAGATYTRAGAGGNKTVRQTQPSPIVLRFPHPFARYEDVQDAAKETETTYVIFGPGQSIPHFFAPEYGTGAASFLWEPSVAISTGAMWSKDTEYPVGYPYIGGVGPAAAVPGYPAGNLNMTANKRAIMATPSYAYLPNQVDIGDNSQWVTGTKTTEHHGWTLSPAGLGVLPPSTAYQITNPDGWKSVDNYEPAQGDPNQTQYNQNQNTYGRYLSDHFYRNDLRMNTNPTGNIWSSGSTGHAHPFTALGQGVMDTSTAYHTLTLRQAGPLQDKCPLYSGQTLADYTWHMDGGYAPGGNFLDDRVVRNPTNFGFQIYPWIETVDVRWPAFGTMRVGDNASMYRVAGVMLKTLPDGTWTYTADNFATGVEGTADRDVVVIDATRIQNAEELATVISCAINEWPGTGALKALGGTFLPSFQHAHKQDRYSWVKLPIDETPATGGLNGRVDNLTYMYNNNKVGGDGSQLGLNGLIGASTTQGFTIGIGPTSTGAGGNLIPYELPPFGVGRIWAGPDGTAGHWISSYSSEDDDNATGQGIDTNPTQVPQGTIGNYFFYRSVSAFDDTALKATGASRSFYLSENYRTGMRCPENPTLDIGRRWAGGGTAPVGYYTYPGNKYLDCAVMNLVPGPVESGAGMFIWTKTGNHRWDNGGIGNIFSQAAVTAHKTAYGLGNVSEQLTTSLSATMVHFNGLHDAVDRTRPIGAVGWSGNQYSMLNSIGAAYDVASTAYTIPRGRGAWHAKLGFSPYGNALACHNSNWIGQYAPSTINSGGNAAQTITNPTASQTDNTFNDSDVASTAAGHEQYSAGWATIYNKPSGTSERHYVVITHESELPLIARADRLGVVGIGDRLSSLWKTANDINRGPPGLHASPSTVGMQWFDGEGAHLAGKRGTTWWSSDIHNPARFTAPANAGPYVEAQVHSSMLNPTTDATSLNNGTWGSEVDTPTDNIQADACAAPSGDLFLSKDWVGDANRKHEAIHSIGGWRENERPTYSEADGSPHRYWNDPLTAAADASGATQGGKSPGLNFTVEHIVWKRMDGGNLSLPAPNARGMGAVPWTWRGGYRGPQGAASANYPAPTKTGETIYGNCRFSFETTNSAMMPIIQAQELAHPNLAEHYPHEIGNILMIPNEEIQFESIVVVDDTGQQHRIEGGSPFGTIIRDFSHIQDRDDLGMAPALAGSGTSPNMDIRLPDPDTIPGNIIVRSGFDRIQSYQNESIGTGGLQHPSQPNQLVEKTFKGTGQVSPTTWPTWENNRWEKISEKPNTSLDSIAESFPESESIPNTETSWESYTDNAPLQTAYEPHDRTLYFHITQHDVSYSKREPVFQFGPNPQAGLLTGKGAAIFALAGFQKDMATVNTTIFTGTTLPVASISLPAPGSLWLDPREQLKDGTGRWFLATTKPNGERVIASYTGYSAPNFTGVVFGPGWDETCNGQHIQPSFYTPAGSTRLFAARRMRDHAEVSGNSPDMPLIDWWKLNDAGPTSTNPYDLIVAPKLTPMPIPRMGHHFVNPTMAVLPGHLAHPVYQNIYGGHTACASIRQPLDLTGTPITGTPNMDPNIWFSNLTPNYPPSDIHGGAFTLMSETKVRFDGYGVLASNGTAGEVNRQGGHIIILEADGYYTQSSHFPDPLEVGAYQIIIQPNIFSQQLTGFHQNTALLNTGMPPAAAASAVLNLTGQQVATVVGIIHEWGTHGASGLILADRTGADVRGCEIYLNEIMLDIDPAPGQQFTALPPLATFNPLGVNETSSPAFSRRSLPYHPRAFKRTTPGYTLTIPWWAIPSSTASWSELSMFNVDDYYLFCRSTYGAISAQITLAGYPSHFFQPYVRELESVNPVCYALTPNQGAATIQVDDNVFFPYNTTQYNQVLITFDVIGTKYTATYTSRDKSGDATDTTIFRGVAAPAGFWNAINASHASYNGSGKIWISGHHQNYSHGDILKDETISPFPRILPQVLSGSRDTNNLFLADAYLCMWHHNLGRPMTAFSEGRNTIGAPVAQKPYNIMPESFEMVHYHEFAYAISSGPFALGMKWPAPLYVSGTNGGGAWDNVNHRATLAAGHVNNFGPDGSTFDGYFLNIDGQRAYHEPGHVVFTIAYAANTLTATTNGASVNAYFEALVTGTNILTLNKPSLTNNAVDPDILTSPTSSAPPVQIASKKYFFGAFWPGGSRYGAGASRLDMWGDVERGWNVGDVFNGSCTTYTAEFTAGPVLDHTKIRTDQDVTGTWTHFPTTAGGAPWARNRCFGYRFSVRQPYNRPRWATAIKSVSDAVAGHSAATGHYGYFNGPLVQVDGGTWASEHVSSPGGQTLTGDYVGIMERQTNASHMLGFDLPGWQVRYSDGRRMTRPFGCPVRTLRNASTSRRQFPGDHAGKSIEDVAIANLYYVVDWWGNTTGEDVRRFPVRGFGLRPAFDPEAWRWTQGVQAMSTSLFRASATPSVQEGNRNDANNTEYNAVGGVYTKLADFFNPLDSVRVGDRGDGRGSRCPIFFNEHVAQSVDTVITPTGMMLSYHTAEPPFTIGLLRPRNDTLQTHELPRGITNRLEIAYDDGLMKPEAMAGRNIESPVGNFGMEGLSFQDPVSRLSPRIGVDALTVSERQSSDARNYIIQATQAISLHTDQPVGQRYIFEGAYKESMYPSMTGTTTYTLTDLDFTNTASFTWTDPPAVLRFNNAHGVVSRGGNYIMEVSSYVELFNDKGWGVDTSVANYVLGTHGPTSNPYQSNTVGGLLNPMLRRTNNVDNTIRFLIRPYRALDYRHVALFREGSAGPPAGPQSSSAKPFFQRTAGGRYGLFNYEMSNARALTSGIYVSTSNPSPTNAPYVASYIPDQANYNTNHSHGPKIHGASVYSSTNLKSHIARLIISENSLQHYRSDAPRRQSQIQSEDEEEDDSVVILPNYAVEPRYSQSLHPKGEGGTTDFNTSDHNDDTPDNYSGTRTVDW